MCAHCHPASLAWAVSVLWVPLEAHLDTKVQVHIVNEGGVARRGEAAGKGCVIKQDSTWSSWDPIPLGQCGPWPPVTPQSVGRTLSMSKGSAATRKGWQLGNLPGNGGQSVADPGQAAVLPLH